MLHFGTYGSSRLALADSSSLMFTSCVFDSFCFICTADNCKIS